MPVRTSHTTISPARDIFAMVAVVLCSALFVLLLATRLPTRMEAMHVSWARGVHAAVDGLGQSPSIEQLEIAKQGLLDLTVAAPDKAKHLALVLAIIALQDEKADAMQRLTEAVRAVGK